jgi:hypothetical protein
MVPYILFTSIIRHILNAHNLKVTSQHFLDKFRKTKNLSDYPDPEPTFEPGISQTVGNGVGTF